MCKTCKEYNNNNNIVLRLCLGIEKKMEHAGDYTSCNLEQWQRFTKGTGGLGS